MIPYASVTRTRRNLRVLREHGWRMLISPANPKPPGDFRYAIDNGAWPAHKNGLPFDEPAFTSLVDSRGADADFIVVPDVVAGGMESLRLSVGWLPRLIRFPRLYIAVQDGMSEQAVCNVLSLRPGLGIFVGGSTEWKLRTLPRWGWIAHEMQKPLHVGRVNSARRIRLCAEAGADSFDGTSVTMYAETMPLLNAANAQPSLLTPALMC